jgi:hypothetical protein
MIATRRLRSILFMRSSFISDAAIGAAAKDRHKFFPVPMIYPFAPWRHYDPQVVSLSPEVSRKVPGDQRVLIVPRMCST